MKKNAAVELARRRDALRAQIVTERFDLVQHGTSLRSAAQVIDKVRHGIHHLKKHPEVMLFPLLVTTMSRPRRLLTLGMSGLGAWRFVQRWRRRLLS